MKFSHDGHGKLLRLVDAFHPDEIKQPLAAMSGILFQKGALIKPYFSVSAVDASCPFLTFISLDSITMCTKPKKVSAFARVKPTYVFPQDMIKFGTDNKVSECEVMETRRYKTRKESFFNTYS